MMEDVNIGEWPGHTGDEGGNSWTPAYGYRIPQTFFERGDFLGNPDADYFFPGDIPGSMYLETIIEETSDDLCSDSDLSETKSSSDNSETPLGWITTDSEAGSVIRLDIDRDGYESERECACPAKRRKQSEELTSISRSSSLVQFETLEKECQEICNTSPSKNQFTFDSIDGVQPNLKMIQFKLSSDSDSSLHGWKSMDNLKSWRSSGSLPALTSSDSSNSEGQRSVNGKFSVENLSEDSGYGDHVFTIKGKNKKEFTAYDGYEVNNHQFGNFGTSYFDLSSLDQYDDPPSNRKKRINHETKKILNIEETECAPKNNAVSLPNLLASANFPVGRVSSVPEDINLFDCGESDKWRFESGEKESVAFKNWDLGDLTNKPLSVIDENEDLELTSLSIAEDLLEELDERMSRFKREGSYAEAMSNRVDLSDDESFVKPARIIESFDKKVLKTISETSLHSNVDIAPPSCLRNNFTSTPNVSICRHVNYNRSTSTSGLSDYDEKPIHAEVKGVHFSPVVSEVNWNDESSTASMERESSYSLQSTPEREISPQYYSQPDLQEEKQRFVESLQRFKELAKSEPEMKPKRRGSQLLKKDRDGCVVKAYVDGDGIHYQHTHLDVDNVYKSPTSPEPTVRAVATPRASSGAAMEPATRTKKNKFGGFFARLSSRFSHRKKKSETPKAAAPPPPVRATTTEDYIYIPLKGPERNNNKPPRAPPRVGAGGGAAAARRAIDPHRPMEPMGLIETDLDTHVTQVIADGKTRSLLDLGLGGVAAAGVVVGGLQDAAPRPHKSMEFLLDKQNLKVVEPPENELQKNERVMSEHQLRVQRSLQKLTLPDWYKNSPVPQEGFLLKKNHQRESRWTGTGSRTTSMSSLGSPSQSPMMALSPPPKNSQPFVRWSTSKLNSTASSPCASTRSSFNVRQHNGSVSPCSSVRSSFSYRQPYLGWRSQERLSTRPRTPAERLANTLLASQNHNHAPEQSPEIQTSIKEVTSAIVHYVSGLRPDDVRKGPYDSQDLHDRSSSASPRGSQKLCWLESSFVGIKPADSPQTPLGLSEGSNAPNENSLRLELHNHKDVSSLLSSSGHIGHKLSPGSTTLEDVLDSLLGLPSTARSASPGLQETVSANVSPMTNKKELDLMEQFRRRSEGSEPSYQNSTRRVSLSSSPVLKCRYSKCGRIAFAASTEGNAFKNCHNCSYVYCSRVCRRAHWEKHRKSCLFSRIGTLCRQVIAYIKSQKDILLHFSNIARRGYLSHGLGTVKCFFPNSESAELFLSKGIEALGDLTYLRWLNILPNEMGPNMYAELIKMCKNYNPDSKIVIYVSICVMSPTPTQGSAKWERQLVSRCAKMRLSKEVPIPDKVPDNPETLIIKCLPLIAEDFIKMKELKEICVRSVQNQLRKRGVSLRKQHPDVYKLLLDYAEGIYLRFRPVTLYPTDVNTGRTFMCIIMLEADSETIEQVEKAAPKFKTVDIFRDN